MKRSSISRKVLTAVLAGVLAISLFGCTVSKPTGTPAPFQTGMKHGGYSSSSSSASPSSSSSESGSQSSSSQSSSVAPVTAEGFPSVLYENDAVKITAISYEMSEYGYYVLTFEGENKTDQNMRVTTDAFAVNDVHIESALWLELSGKETKTGEMMIGTDYLEDAFIDEPTFFEFWFNSYSDDYETIFVDSAYSRLLLVSEEETVSSRIPKEEFGENSIVLIDIPECFMIIYADEYNEEYGTYTLYVYAENYTDGDCYLDLESCTINGEDCNPFYITRLQPGKASHGYMRWNLEELSGKGIEITDPWSIEFDLSFNDIDTWTYYFDDTVTVELE